VQLIEILVAEMDADRDDPSALQRAQVRQGEIPVGYVTKRPIMSVTFTHDVPGISTNTAPGIFTNDVPVIISQNAPLTLAVGLPPPKLCP
jgi:hypothetical protein